jgi:signal transduction histidine kinase
VNKQKLSTIFMIVTVIGWGFSLALIFPEHVTTLMAIAIIFPMIPAAIVIWIQSGTIPNTILKKINDLAIKIDHDLEKERTQIETTEVPKEIMPLIKAINRLLRHQNDRYLQERDFTSHASHELRTPLAGIRLQTELAMMTNAPEKRDKALRNIMKSVDRGTRLVEQLLAISRLTAENVELAMESVDMLALGERVVGENMAAARQKNIALSFQPEIASLFVEASEQSLAILIDNLLRNAITYTPSEGKITLSMNKNLEKKVALLSVNDTGPGIPVHLRSKVLERFEKGEKGERTGTGLGLSIVKRIVELHDGQITLLEGENNKGLKISIELPKIHTY